MQRRGGGGVGRLGGIRVGRGMYFVAVGFGIYRVAVGGGMYRVGVTVGFFVGVGLKVGFIVGLMVGVFIGIGVGVFVGISGLILKNPSDSSCGAAPIPVHGPPTAAILYCPLTVTTGTVHSYVFIGAFIFAIDVLAPNEFTR